MRRGLLALMLGLWPATVSAFDVSNVKALAPILAPDADARICFQRRYDRNHLRAHPSQKVAELTLFLYVHGYDAKGETVKADPDYISYDFALSGRRRADRKTLDTSGRCFGVDKVRCNVDCDGGGVSLEKSANGPGVLLKLDERGVEYRGDDGQTLATFTSGKDDKVFLLEPAPASACAALARVIGAP
jgi:hypothetical protein